MVKEVDDRSFWSAWSELNWGGFKTSIVAEMGVGIEGVQVCYDRQQSSSEDRCYGVTMYPPRLRPDRFVL